MHQDRTIVLQGRRFHYTEWGAPTAPALIMLHGVTGHARTWDEEAAALASRYRVLALDQRGHGDSDPAPHADYTVAALSADLTAFADSLRITRASIVGLSMGGRVAIAFAGQAPQRVERLVVVDIGPDISEAGLVDVVSAYQKGVDGHWQIEEIFSTGDRVVARWTGSGTHVGDMNGIAPTGKKVEVDAISIHRVQHGTKPVEGGFTWKYDRGLREAVRSGTWRDPIDLWPLWRGIACPILLVRGGDSDVLSPEIAKRMVEENPNTRLAEIAGAGHTVPGDQPLAFRTLLNEFLAT